MRSAKGLFRNYVNQKGGRGEYTKRLFQMIRGEVGGLPKMMDDDDGLKGDGNWMFMSAYEPDHQFLK